MKEITINYVNKEYQKQSKATIYEIYFIYNKILYKMQEKTIQDNMLKFDITSKARGSKKTLRMRILKPGRKLQNLQQLVLLMHSIFLKGKHTKPCKTRSMTGLSRSTLLRLSVLKLFAKVEMPNL